MSIGALSIYPSETGSYKPLVIGQWERPERDSRNATSSVRAWLPPLAAALVVVMPGSTIENRELAYSILPVSSTAQQVIRTVQLVWTPVERIEEAGEADVVPGLIDSFRKSFGLSDNAISELFGVSRQTVYNWRTKKTVADYPERIRALADILSEVSSEDIPYLKRTLFYPTNDGLLMQDVLSETGWKETGSQEVRRITLELASKAAQLRLRDEKTISRLERFNQTQAG